MIELITGEQLEASSYDKPNTTAECSECGTMIDVEQECYGVSIDGEKHCCWGCSKAFAMLGSICMTPPLWGYLGIANYKGEEITTKRSQERESLERAAELAELAWGVKSYIERG